MKEAREDLTNQTRQYEQEILVLNEQLNNKRDFDLIRLKDFAERGGNSGSFNGTASAAEVR